MSRFKTLAGFVVALTAVAVATGCNPDVKVQGPRVSAENAIFERYVAMGNSLTAGWQSDGINDSTQRRSWAFILAGRMGTRFAYPSITMPGCPPPLNSFQAQTRVGGGTPTTCALRSPTGFTDILNSVAVPGHQLIDAITLAPGVSNPSNILTQLVLGGRTQVTRALDARPTFVSIWLGNNNALSAILSGRPGLVTPQATFEQLYDDMIAELMAGAPEAKGILIGVGNAVLTPYLFPAAFLTNPGFLVFVNTAAGTPVTIHPSCTNSNSLIGVGILAQIRAGTHPAVIVCAKDQVGFPAPIGDIFILDAAEQTQANQIVAAYNDYIEAKAAEIDFAYWDPNTLFTALSAKTGGTGEIPLGPNPASASAPFGAIFSLDGVHPSNEGHIRVANSVAGAINDKYGTSLAEQ